MSGTSTASEDSKIYQADYIPNPAFAKHAAPVTPKPQREKFIGFVKDPASARVLHEALETAFPDGNHFHNVDFRTALKLLAAMRTPEIILVDISGEDQAINAIMDLGDVVEPGTTVLVIGEAQNVNFYRTVTKGMGVREYLPKPLTRPAVEQNFLPLLATGGAGAVRQGGRMLAVAGARGGVGTSTIAGNLAWMIGVEMHRHTLLLDADLYSGTVALGLNVKHDSGLCLALQSPERIDQLLIERATQKAGERLHVLSALESLSKVNPYHETAAAVLAQALRSRYNFVLADTGTRQYEFARDLNFLAHRKILVLDPSQIAIRNFERLLTLAAGPLQSPKHILVLNMAGRPGGLTQSYMEQALGLSFDVVIPDLPRIIPKAAQYGQAAAALRGPFRNAITKLATALGAEISAKAA